MKIKVQIDPAYPEPEVHILAAEITDEIQALVQRLSEKRPSALVCYDRDSALLVEQEQLIRVYASRQKVYAQTAAGEYLLRRRLYELEEMLDAKAFVRISNAEIVNLHFVERLDLSITGTIGMRLKNGETSYVSRRYVNHIKTILGI